jgi:type VI secretion system secreted protein VgrG
MVDSTGTTTAAFDTLNRATRVDQPQVGAIDYGYDLGGNRTSLQLPGGRITRMGYDAADQLIKVTDGAARVTDLAYDARGLATKTTLPNGIERRAAYDASSRLVSPEETEQ